MADERIRSLVVMRQLSRLRDAEIEGQRATMEQAAARSAEAERRVSCLAKEIATLDGSLRELMQPGIALRPAALLGYGRYRAMTEQSRTRAQEAAVERQIDLENEQAALRALLAERNALNARHDRLSRGVEADAQRAHGRELDHLVAARLVAKKETPC